MRNYLDIANSAPAKKKSYLDIANEAPVIIPEVMSQKKSMLQPLPKNPILAGLEQSRRELAEIPGAHFVNQFLYNAPRAIASRSGYEYPEAESAAGTVLAKGAGIAGAVLSPLNKIALLKGAKLLPRIIAGATSGALYTPTEGKGLDIGQRAGQAVAGGTLAGVIPPLARGVVAGAKAIGKIPSYLAKSASDYITQKVSPRAQQIYQEAVSKFTPQIQKFAEEKLKVTSNTINSIKKFGVDAIGKIRQVYGDSVDPIVQKIEQGFTSKRELANKAYGEAMQNVPTNFGKTIDTRNTLKTMQGVFKGSLGEATRGQQGNRLYQIMQELKSRIPMPKGAGSIPATPTQLVRQLRGENLQNIAGEVRLNVKQFSELRDALNNLYRENPYDRNIAKVLNSLYDDGERAGLAGLQKARALQRQAFQAEENLLKKGLINQNKLNNFQKLTEAEKRQLQAIEKYTGEKFVDDLDAITADRALDKLREYNPEKITADLMKAKDPAYTEIIRKQYKELLGDKADELINDIIGHRRGVKIKKGALVGAGIGIAGGGSISAIRRKFSGGIQ